MTISRYLDHAVLVPQMPRDEAVDNIKKGIEYKVKTVCVRPCDIDIAKQLTAGSETKVSVVLGFPHGTQLPESKIAEAELYCKKGVSEIDMVANYGWIRSGLWNEVRADIKGVVDAAHKSGVLVKVIFETAQLNTEQIVKTTEICIEAGADFVKTSTGFNGDGAKEEDVDTMLRTAKGRIKVKPSGGIRAYDRAKMFVDKGVDRLGVNGTSSPAICDGEKPEAAQPKGTCNCCPSGGY
ncbi:MAG: deoxyribose-phosphate aldolase [Planctomycetaceae bacterium]|jgi:deoxyribose-phosphate aldolase|nr:deoxyribose-phosphate aldolase [Planctomycetaceae bacterium]